VPPSYVSRRYDDPQEAFRSQGARPARSGVRRVRDADRRAQGLVQHLPDPTGDGGQGEGLSTCHVPRATCHVPRDAGTKKPPHPEGYGGSTHVWFTYQLILDTSCTTRPWLVPVRPVTR